MNSEDRGLAKARKRALDLKLIKKPEEIQISHLRQKRFTVYLPSGKKVHFGIWPPAQGTFLDHGDKKKRDAYRARHGAILRGGKKAYLDPESPSYWSWNVLW